jgi:hypothetical protein
MAVVGVALLAGLAGVVIGRTTKAGAPKTSQLPSWRPLPPAPIADRIGAGAVWTGTEMIVWGGVTGKVVTTPGPCDRCASDGAAYNPATGTWRVIAPAPAGVEGGGGAGVIWTGNEMVVWASNSPDGPAGAAAYNPRTNSWRRLPAGPLGKRELYVSVWSGKELIVIGGALGDTLATPLAAALDPEAGTWRLVPGLNRLTGLLPGPAVWDGHDVLVTAARCSTGTNISCRSIFLAYNPATDAVRELKLPAYSADFGADQAASLKPIGWTGTEVVFSTTVPGSVRLIRYNPTTGVWTKGAYAPCYIPFTHPTQTAWLGNRYVAACGDDGLQIYSPATDTWTWRTLTPGPSPLTSLESSAIVWTGTDLIAWSGGTGRRERTPLGGAALTLR